MFQPRSGTANSLYSVANIMSYISPSHRSTVFWILSLHPPCPDPPPIRHPLTELNRSLHPIFHSRSGIRPPGQTSFHYCWPPPPVLQSLSCRLISAPQVPVAPCSFAPQSHFCRLFPLLVVPLFLTSTSLTPLSTPLGSPF